MAAVLEEYFACRISTERLVLWLYSDASVVETENDVLKDKSLRAEFLPFFINYLRDHTSHLVHGGSSAGLSPAKTPASAQKFRRSSLHPEHSTDEHHTLKQEPSNRNTRRRPNRNQLFSPSPLKSDVSDETLTPGSICGEIDSPSSLPEADACPQDGQFYLKTPLNDCKGRTKRVSPSFNKKDEQLTLGQYIKSDGFSLNHPKGRRRSDQHNKYNASQKTPAHNKRRFGGKGNKASYSDSSLKYKTASVLQDGKTPKFVLDDSEEFPVVGAPSSSVSTPTRRITPTAVTDDRKALVNRVKRHPLTAPVFSKSYQEESNLSHLSPCNGVNQQNPSLSRGLEKERELLRLERLKQQASQNSSSMCPVSDMSPVKTPVKSSDSSTAFSCQSELTTACRDQVTYPEYVDKLAELYSACTKECLMPNLTIELYFLVHLLTAKGSEPSVDSVNKHCDLEDVNYLCSIHNCVQFAVFVLHSQFWLLTFLDRTTLKLLADLPHLSDFSPVLKSHLESVLDGNTAPRSFIPTAKSPIQAVPFLADTDNRTNFPSEGAFHSFRKQRDKFYELVREWLDHHQVPGWSMKAAMSRRIKELVQGVVNTANCAHFARLFSSQLTRMCQGDHLISGSQDDSRERGFLGDLKKTNPEKFKRLEERFSMPTTSAGPSPPPSFHGCQEFFKEFIVAADSFVLNQHLINNFSSKLLELNDMQFGLTDQDGDPESSTVDDELCSSFSSTLQSARLLAKFLGFLVFLPYQGGDVLPESVQTDVIALRNKSQPPMDVLGVLQLSYHHRRLVMTVPWVVEYLSMMDPMAVQLESFKVLLRRLVHIYRSVSRMLSLNPTSYNMLLILLVLGWLFEVPGMPASMYFMSFTDDFIIDCVPNHQAPPSMPLDSLHLVDQQLLYLCCPYLGDVRVLLTDASLGCGSKTTPMKKITPISAKTPPKTIQTAHQLQQDLEKNFFDSHSPSLKKTVDFVSSRLSSNCIKHIDATLVSQARNTALTLLESEVGSEEVWSTERKRSLLRQVKARADEIAIATREAAEKTAKEFVFGRSQAALSALLPIEISEQVSAAVAYITSRLAMERASRWIDTQIQAAIQQEINNNIDKIIRSAKKEGNSKPKLCQPSSHDPRLPAPSVLIQQYKDILRYLLTGSVVHCVTVEEIADLLRETQQVLHSRQDLTPLAFQMIQQLSIDLASALVVFRPAYLSSTACTDHRTNTSPSVGDQWPKQHIGGTCSDLPLNQQLNLRFDKIHISGQEDEINMNIENTCYKQSSSHNGKGSEMLVLNGTGRGPCIHSCLEDELGYDHSKSRTDINENSQGSKKLKREVIKESTSSYCDTTPAQNGWERVNPETSIHIDQKHASLQESAGITHTNCECIPIEDSKQTTDLRQVQEKNQDHEEVFFQSRTILNVSNPAVAGGNSEIHQPINPNLGLDCESPVSLSILNIFISLWKDDFKRQVPPELFLCPKNAVLIEKIAYSEDSWNVLIHLITTLVTNRLTGAAEVVECLSDLVQSDWVDVTETVAGASWVIAQRVTQQDCKSNTTLCQGSTQVDLMPLLHILMDRCPNGYVLQCLCENA